MSGYQVRYAKVPITAANFDDTTVTTAVTYTGRRRVPGSSTGSRSAPSTSRMATTLRSRRRMSSGTAEWDPRDAGRRNVHLCRPVLRGALQHDDPDRGERGIEWGSTSTEREISEAPLALRRTGSPT